MLGEMRHLIPNGYILVLVFLLYLAAHLGAICRPVMTVELIINCILRDETTRRQGLAELSYPHGVLYNIHVVLRPLLVNIVRMIIRRPSALSLSPQ